MTTKASKLKLVECFEFKASDDDHRKHINGALDSLENIPQDLIIVSEEKDEIPANKSILSIFSPTIRRLLSAPSSSSINILLPDCSTSSIKHLLNIISTGFSYSSKVSFSELSDIIATASLLEIDLSKLTYDDLAPKKSAVEKQTASAVTADKIVNPELEEDTFNMEVNAIMEEISEQIKEDCPVKVKQEKLENQSEQINKELSTFQDHVNPTPVQDQVNPTLVQDQVKSTPVQVKQEMADAKSDSSEKLLAIQTNCQICHKSESGLYALWKHYFNSHLYEELKLKLPHFIKDNSCVICQKKFSVEKTAFQHVGILHHKLNDILISKNMIPLPTPKMKGPSKVDDHSEAIPKSKTLTTNKNTVHNSQENIEPPRKESTDEVDNEKKVNSNVKAHDAISASGLPSSKIIRENIDSILMESVEPENSMDWAALAKNKEHEGNLKSNGIASDIPYMKNDCPDENLLDNNTQSASLKCQMCDTIFISGQIYNIHKHYFISHLQAEIKTNFSHLIKENICVICKASFAKERSAFQHLATNHQKINEILAMKHMTPLPLTKSKALSKDISLNSSIGSEDLNHSNAAEEYGASLENIVDFKHQETNRKRKSIGTIVSGLKSKSTKLDDTFSSETFNELMCQICNTSEVTLTQMLRHYSDLHFKEAIRRSYENLMEGNTCIECNKKFAKKLDVSRHFGSFHGKVNENLKESGLKPLSIPNFKQKKIADSELVDAVKKVPEAISVSRAVLEESELNNEPTKSDIIKEAAKEVDQEALKAVYNASKTNNLSKYINGPTPVDGLKHLASSRASRYSQEQVLQLKLEFQKNNYISEEDKVSLSERTGIEKSRILRWFNDQRKREKKQIESTKLKERIHDARKKISMDYKQIQK